MGVENLFWLFSFIPHFQAADSLHPTGNFFLSVYTYQYMWGQEKALSQTKWVCRQVSIGPILKEAVRYNFH